MTSADYAWRSRGISEIWSLPYVPNVLRYNRSVERTATGGDLTEDQVAEAVFSESQLHVILDEFKRILRDRGVVTVTSGRAPPRSRSTPAWTGSTCLTGAST